MLTRGDVHDPGIGFITLTRVQVSADLQVAKVFYTTLGDPRPGVETQKALERATPFFRRQIGARVRLRRVPEVEFRFDETIQHQDRIEQILRDLREEEAARRVRHPDAPTPLAMTTATDRGLPARPRRFASDSASC